MLKQQIQEATKESLKSGDQITLGTLRMLLAAISVKEKERRYKIATEDPSLTEARLIEKSESTDEQVLETISSEIKKRRDAIVLYNQGKRPELAEKEGAEIKVLQKYLPEQLSGEEIKKLVAESIAKIKAEIKDPVISTGQVMGKVMAELNPKIKGKAEGGDVSKIVKELLGK